ncbi:PepSY domain-containing protein [Comamonas nitrativorans]|uniref:PepSY domain-containing protein n=1 Tax=Comamonas nitrativorans TaxID=108437 RepID=A0ABV9GU43_9BURK
MSNSHPRSSASTSAALHRRSWWPSLVAACLLATSASAWADDDCQVPIDQWQPRSAVQAMAQQRGWQVERIHIDDGCYEVRGTDAQGRHFKAKVDPKTLEPIKFKLKHEKRTKGHETSPGLPVLAPPAGAPAASAVRPAIRSSARIE